MDGLVQDAYIYFNGLASKGYAYWHKGDAHRTGRIADRLIKFGKRHGNVRSLVCGHCCQGWKALVIGDIDAATACFKSAVDISADPWYSQFPKLALCYGAISSGKIEAALPLLDQLIAFSDTNGAEFVGDPARFFKALTTILNGQVTDGLGVMERLLAQWQSAGCRLRRLNCGYVMARVYSLLFQGAMQSTGNPDSPQIRTMADHCIRWYQTCVSEARHMGSQVMEGQALLGLGNALAALGKHDQAGRLLNQSVDVLAKANASHHLEQARSSLATLKKPK